jgi:DNA-binding SARP family transcriptional activator
MVRFELLGSLRVVDDDQISLISARKMEIVLSVLLIRANQVVTVEEFAAEVWGSRPPARSKAALYVYISQLRKFLTRPGHEHAIVTRSPGYVYRKDADVLDVDCFQQLVERGRSYAFVGDHEQAVEQFRAALKLWRGPALLDLRNGPIVNGFANWLEEGRLECAELLISSLLALGQCHEPVRWLRSLVVDNPLHESFYHQLMIALYQSGRRAEALEVYQSARAVLSRELGLEPQRSLRELQRAILDADADEHVLKFVG